MVCKCAAANLKYKLLGFESGKGLGVIMIVSTGKIMRVKLVELLRSEVIDDFSPAEVKAVHKKFFSRQEVTTIYDLRDRNEQSWMIYLALTLILFALLMFSSIAATKLIVLQWMGIVVTPGTFLYSLTFLVIDILNEFYGLRLARRAILFVFLGNALVISMLNGIAYLPGLPGWELDSPYNKVVSHVFSVLIASLVAFVVSEYVNTYLLSKIKALTRSRFLFLRVFFSSFVAAIIDSLLFCFLAFYGVMETSALMNMLIVQIFIKVTFACVNVLPAYGARALFKRYVFTEGD